MEEWIIYSGKMDHLFPENESFIPAKWIIYFRKYELLMAGNGTARTDITNGQAIVRSNGDSPVLNASIANEGCVSYDSGKNESFICGKWIIYFRKNESFIPENDAFISGKMNDLLPENESFIPEKWFIHFREMNYLFRKMNHLFPGNKSFISGKMNHLFRENELFISGKWIIYSGRWNISPIHFLDQCGKMN